MDSFLSVTPNIQVWNKVLEKITLKNPKKLIRYFWSSVVYFVSVCGSIYMNSKAILEKSEFDYNVC